MKKTQNILTLTFLLISFFSFSQKKNTISGKIIEKSTSQPLEYITVEIFDNATLKYVNGTSTKNNGEFSVLVPTGTYNIKFSFMGFKPNEIKNKSITENTNLGTISLVEDIKQIEAVVVRAEKSTVEIKLDKKVFNVGQDMTVKGGTASDVLDNVPSVTVDGDGTVSLRGNSNVRILIDGRPSNAINVSDALKTISADALDKVEVITNPSARYDAEGGGGIINIILKKGKNNGTNGTFIATVGNPKNYGASGTLNYKGDSFNLFSSLGYNDSKAPGMSLTDSNYLNTDGTLLKTVNERVDRTSGRKGFNYNFGMDWYLTKTLTWTNSATYRKNDGSSPINDVIYNYETNNNFISNRFNDQFTNTNDIEYSTNFTKKFKKEGHKLTVDGSVSKNIDNDNSIITNSYIGATSTTSIETSKNYQTQNRTLLQTDYVLPIGKNTQFEAGYKGNFNELNSDFKVGSIDNAGVFNLYPSFSNIFNYKEKTNALYTQYGSKIKKFSYLLGLRYENTSIDNRLLSTNFYSNKKYNTFFPSAFLTYQISDESTFSANYSRRIERPRNRFIIPFANNYTSNINLFIGNSDINPSFTDALDFGYMNKFKKITLTSSIYFNKTKNPFQFTRRPSGDSITTVVNGLTVVTPVYISTPVNLDTENRFGFEFNINYTPYKWWRLNGNFNLFQSKIVGDYQYTLNGSTAVVSQDVNTTSRSWFTRISSKITLPFKIDWQTNATYNAPQKTFQGKSIGVFAANLAFSKDVLKDKATISLNANDIFNSRKMIRETNLPQLTSYSEMQFRQRQINLSFTYRFNKLKTERDKQPRKDGDGGDMEF